MLFYVFIIINIKKTWKGEMIKNVEENFFFFFMFM
jgi:hypothetical protein